MYTRIFEIAKSLPLLEQIEPVETLWDSIVQDGYEPELTTALAKELDRRPGAHN